MLNQRFILSLMSNFSMVFQNVYLFNDSIENNIKFGKPAASHEEVVAAAKAARGILTELQRSFQNSLT